MTGLLEGPMSRLPLRSLAGKRMAEPGISPLDPLSTPGMYKLVSVVFSFAPWSARVIVDRQLAWQPLRMPHMETVT